ncbi:MAG: phosphomannomutase/phosphoglucomutase [bacterium]
MSLKKPSAFDYHLAQKTGGKIGFDWRVLPLVGMGVAFISALLFGSQLYVVGLEKFEAVHLKNKAEEIFTDLEPRFKSFQAQSREFSLDPRVLKIFRSQAGQEDLDVLARQLEGEHPGYARVKMMRCEQIDREARKFPKLSYGALDLVSDACKTGQQVKAEIHLFGTEDEHINFVSPVIDDQPIGAILFSVKTDIIRNLEKSIKVSSGYVELRQGNGGWSDLKLLSFGSINELSEVAKNPIPIPGTHLIIDYQSGQKFGLLNIHSMSALIIGVSASLLLFGTLLVVRLKYGAPQKIQTKRAKSSNKESEKVVEQPVVEEPIVDNIVSKEEIAEVSVPTAVSVTKEIFRAYDIRGVIDKTLSKEVAYSIGQAIGSEAIERGVAEVVVGRDGRLSGPSLVQGLTEGLISTGINVIDIGQVPTGVLYYATHQLKTGSGVMVTGSHNPPNYNGFKIMLGGQTLSGEGIYALYERINENKLVSGRGGVQEMNLLQDYVEEIADDIQLDEPLKVVIDCGNGVGGIIAEELFNEIGAETIPLYCDVDGEFPNHHPDPSVPENLQDLILSVQQLGADIGLAFDGDADRLGVVTRDGDIIYPDRLMMLYADDVLSRNPGATIIFDVKCTGKLAPRILHNGGSPLMWKTGHSFIKGKMQETEALLAGEMSGHIFFKERWYGFDDGLYAGARLLEILAQEDRPPTEILNELPDGCSTPELKVEMQEGENFAFMDDFVNRASFKGSRVTKIDGIRADFNDGWGLIRCSNTTPVLVLRFEADNEEALERIKNKFKQQMTLVRSDLELPF